MKLKDSMKVRSSFCIILMVMACVIASTAGCKRRPKTYAGIEPLPVVGTPVDQGPIDPHSQNK